jgi:hypothetical protein
MRLSMGAGRGLHTNPSGRKQMSVQEIHHYSGFRVRPSIHLELSVMTRVLAVIVRLYRRLGLRPDSTP